MCFERGREQSNYLQTIVLWYFLYTKDLKITKCDNKDKLFAIMLKC